MSTRIVPVARATGTALDEEAEPVRGVLIYEDFVTGLRARNVFEQCAAQFGSTVHSSCR